MISGSIVDRDQPAASPLLGLIVVRNGQLPLGALEVIAECAGRAIVVGDAVDAAVVELSDVATDVTVVDPGALPFSVWPGLLATIVDGDAGVVLPASADGRDLAPALALARRCPLHAGALRVTCTEVDLIRAGGLESHRVVASPPFVATLQPGVRTVTATDRAPTVRRIDLGTDHDAGTVRRDDGRAGIVRTEAILPPDVSTMDLAEAPRIVAGGAGLDSIERFDRLGDVATRLGASLGTTRVVTDRGWLAHERQIGTTGVVVDPELYVAFAISGAVQHTSGLGQPDHVISVNSDPHCPMTQLADLAIVSEANAVIDELDRLLTHEVHDGGA